MRSGLTMRMYRPEDREKVFRLWSDFIAPDRLEDRKDAFVWLTERNPSLDGRSPYHVVLDGDRLVAHYGLMPVRFMVDGKPVSAYVCHDIYVHRQYRGREAGVSEALVRALETADSFVLALWFAPFNYALHRRSGWLDISGCRTAVKLYTLRPFLADSIASPTLRRIVSGVTAAFFKLLDLRLAFHRRPRFELESVSSFDGRFDRFAEEVSPEFGAIAFRDSAYLNWKYAGRPHMRYRIVAAVDSGRIVGYIVFRVDDSPDGKKGIIVDLLASPRRTDVCLHLVRRALRTFSAERVEYAVCVVTCPEFQQVLRRCNFFRARKSSPMMIAAWEGHFGKERVTRAESWYITRGDGDGDFWTFESRTPRTEVKP